MIVYLVAPDDENGNPQRGWICEVRTPGDMLSHVFVDQDGDGWQALVNAMGETFCEQSGVIPTVNINVQEYRRWRDRFPTNPVHHRETVVR